MHRTELLQTVRQLEGSCIVVKRSEDGQKVFFFLFQTSEQYLRYNLLYEKYEWIQL